jgi:hypothetical protein
MMLAFAVARRGASKMAERRGYENGEFVTCMPWKTYEAASRRRVLHLSAKQISAKNGRK